MAVVKRMSSKATVGKLEKYLKQEGKTEDKLISGMNCDSNNFAKECNATNLLYNKNQKDNDRKYYHIIQSFSPKDNDTITYEQAHKIGREFANKNFKGFEVLVVTHKDKEHVHNHFVINSVSLETGKKYYANNKSLWKMRIDSNTLCKENGLVNSIQPLDKRAKEKITSPEIRKTLRGEEVWKTDLKAQIKTTVKTSKTFEQFQKNIKRNYGVDCRIRETTVKGERKEILEYKTEKINVTDEKKYTKKGKKSKDGYISEKRLGTDYGKENIYELTRRNEERARAESTTVIRGTEETTNNTRTNNTFNGGDIISENEAIRSGADESGKYSTQKDIGELHEQLQQIRGYDKEYNPTEQRNRDESNKQTGADQRAREKENRGDSEQSKTEQRDIERELPKRNTERER